MKKLLILFTIIGIAAPLFALPPFTLSAGGGGIFAAQWKSAELRDQYKNYTGGDYGYGIKGPTEDTQDAMRQGYFDTDERSFAGGIWGFFDATYLEADVALIFTSFRQTVKTPDMPDLSSSLNGDQEHRYLITHLNFSLLGKYPFYLGQKWVIFPLVGIDGQIALADKDGLLYEDFKKIKVLGYDVPNLGEFWNCLWIKLGVGADYSIRDNLYVRGEALYGFKFNSKNDTNQASYWVEDIKGVANGPSLRLGLGYRFL